MQNHYLQENLKNFFEADINFHWVLDESGNVVAINETVKKRLGYTEEDLAGKSILVVHPEERRAEAGRIVKAMLEGRELCCKVPIVSKLGESIPVETYITKGVWNGAPALFGVSNDISELKLSQEMFYKIFNTSPNIIGLTELETGIYIEVNQAFYNILGFSPEEVIGKRARDVVRFDDKYRIPISEKLKHDGFVREEEAVIYSKEGKPITVLMSASLIEIHGKPYNLTIAVDITYRKMTENKMKESHAGLKESEERLKLAHLATNDVVWDWDVVTDTQKWNESGSVVFGWTDIVREPQTAQWWIDRVHPDDRTRVDQSFFSVVNDPDKQFWQEEYRFLKTDGSFAQVKDRGYVLRDEGGNALRMVGAMQDITRERKAAEEIERGGRKLKLAAEAAGFGIWEWNVDTNELVWDESMFNLYGVKKDEFTHNFEAWRSRLHPDDLTEGVNAVENAVHSGSDYDAEFRIVCPGGEVRHIKANAVAQRDVTGRVVRFTGINYDFTSLKLTEETLRESEMKLRLALDVAKMGYWRYVVATGKVEWSKGHDLLFGIPMEAFGGDLASVQAIVHPDDRLHGEINLKRTIEENIPFDNTYRVVHPDGTIRWLFSYGYLYRNKPEDQGFIFGITQDITARKESEEQLQQLSLLRQLLIELSAKFINLPLEMVDEEINASLRQMGEFVHADRSYIFDYDWENQICINTYEWCAGGIEPEIHNLKNVPLEMIPGWVEVHCHGNAMYVPVVADLPESGLKSILQMQGIKSVLSFPMMHHKECKGFVGFDSVSNVHNYSDLEQQVLMVFAQMLVNIGLRKNAEKELINARIQAEESNRLKSAFLANMSHEIRTPMNGILGFLELLKEMDLTSEEKSHYIEVVNNSGKRLLTTINDIIEMSKIEAGHTDVVLSAVSLPEIMQYHYGFFSRDTEKKGLGFICNQKVTGEGSVILTDKMKIDGILTNLINNAIKFTTHGAVEIGNFLEGSMVVFYVRDTGTGIPEGRREVIFERFIQADINLTRPYEGSGLGLSIAKAYVEMLGGRIWVDSETGRGSTFYFTVPYKPIVMKEPEREVITMKSVLKEGLTILVAEDDETSFNYIESILRKTGAILLRAKTGDEALRLIQENDQISLILMDIRMPDMNGIEATRKIREVNPVIPIIAQTAYALAGDRELMLGSGCTDYLSKPVNRNELLDMIGKYC